MTRGTSYLKIISTEKREDIWLIPLTKAPTTTEMSKGQNDNTNNATKKFDYRAVAGRLRTVSLSNNGHPIGVVNLVYGPTYILCFLSITSTYDRFQLLISKVTMIVQLLLALRHTCISHSSILLDHQSIPIDPETCREVYEVYNSKFI